MANRTLYKSDGIKIIDARTLEGREIVTIYDITKFDADYISKVSHRFIPKRWRSDPGRPYNIASGRYTIPIKERLRGVGR